MITQDDFQPDDAIDQLIGTALRARPEVEPPLDLALRSARLAREQEQLELNAALRQSLRVWNRRSVWNWAVTASAAAIVIAILVIGGIRIHQTLAVATSATDTTYPTDDGTTTVDATSDVAATTTLSSSSGRLILGMIALLAAVAVLTVGRSFSRNDQQWTFATPRLT